MLHSRWFKTAGCRRGPHPGHRHGRLRDPRPRPGPGPHGRRGDPPLRRQPRRRLREAAIAAGVANWNASVSNVQLVEAAPGTRAEIQIIATSGWPQATLGPVRPGGTARVELGSQAVTEGHDKTRIAAHELGHSLGLPDTKPGPCSQLMSGSTGGTTCKNATPNATERARVQSLYAGGFTFLVPADGRVLVDAP